MANKEETRNEDKVKRKLGGKAKEYIEATFVFCHPPCYRCWWERSWWAQLKSWIRHKMYCGKKPDHKAGGWSR